MRKNMRILILVFLISGALFADSFEDYKKQNTASNKDFENFVKQKEKEKKQKENEFKKYVKSVKEEYKEYSKILQEELSDYKGRLNKKWDKPEISTTEKWVEYNDDYETKKIVDFEKDYIQVEIIANKGEKDSKEKLKKIIENLILEDKKTAFEKDDLSQNVEKKVIEKIKNIKTSKVKAEPILKPIFIEQKENRTKDEEKEIVRKIVEEKTKDVKLTKRSSKVKGKEIISIKIPLPKNSNLKKAAQYKEYVDKYTQEYRIYKQMVYAIIQSESSFNPMAKSYIPAYGLMQIVPKSAGLDVSKKLYGKSKLLSPSYLYDSEKNVQAGTVYINILYFSYLKNIKNPRSRLYCAIAAYNTGAGNVAKAFTGKRSINSAAVLINKMTADEVYDHLIKKLPYDETKNYLKKVSERMQQYKDL